MGTTTVISQQYSPARRRRRLVSKYCSSISLLAIILVVFFVIFGWINNIRTLEKKDCHHNSIIAIPDSTHHKNKTLSLSSSSSSDYGGTTSSGVLFSSSSSTLTSTSTSTSTSTANGGNINTLFPGQLPGYTGWARPEYTLARLFTIKSLISISTSTTTTTTATTATGEYNNNPIQVGKEFVITVQCKNCSDGEGRNDDEGSTSSLFFLRAYGKAIIPGTVTKTNNTNDDEYDIVFIFFDPGIYTIEVVITFSNPPSILIFPLKDDNDNDNDNNNDESQQQEPSYEGYLLPGFPLIVNVIIDQEQAQEDEQEQEQDNEYTTATTTSSSSSSSEIIQTQTQEQEQTVLCKYDDLIETSSTSAMKKARWVVTDKVMDKEYYSKTMNSTIVSKIGYYDTNVNSLGINMEYKYINTPPNCILIPESAFNKNLHDNQRAFSQCGGSGSTTTSTKKMMHIIYIGDSVLRIQNNMLEKLLKGGSISSTTTTTKVQFHFLSLHGGYRLNQILGPSNVTQFLKDIGGPNDDDDDGDDSIKVILFNTGLHDIHRLCGSEFSNERKEYLDMGSSSFSCVDEYRALLKDFATVIKDFPAQLKVFQSTTAAWPKYGNWGINWDHNGQRMPLVSDFSAAFNEIAYEVLADYKKDGIDIMDGYWITYPRPDNREIGEIGNKLSHPGLEVVSAMSRKWATLILDRVCS